MSFADVATIFNESQRPHASHRKLCSDLKRIQERGQSGKSHDEHGRAHEQGFIFDFIKYLNHVLFAKKSEPWVQKTLKLVVSFFQTSYERGNQSCFDCSSITSVLDAQERGSCPSPASHSVHFRFIEFMIKYLIQGIEAKEKHVRVRICYLLSSCIYAIDEMRYCHEASFQKSLLCYCFLAMIFGQFARKKSCLDSTIKSPLSEAKPLPACLGSNQMIQTQP